MRKTGTAAQQHNGIAWLTFALFSAPSGNVAGHNGDVTLSVRVAFTRLLRDGTHANSMNACDLANTSITSSLKAIPNFSLSFSLSISPDVFTITPQARNSEFERVCHSQIYERESARLRVLLPHADGVFYQAVPDFWSGRFPPVNSPRYIVAHIIPVTIVAL
jgi:hypothetical protein